MSFHSRSYDSDTPPSSGAATPTTLSSQQQSSLGTSLSTMWTGIIRRFSSDSAGFDSSSPHLSTATTSSSFPGYRDRDRAETLKDGINGVYAPPTVRRVASPFRPPPLDPIVLSGYQDNTPASAKLLSSAIAEEIRIMLPERLRIMEDWTLVYSLEQDGASLATLYKKSIRYEGRRLGFVLVVKDGEGGVSSCP
jgi:hypothetical protein